MIAAVALYLALPSPGPRIREVPLTDDALRVEVAALHLLAPPAPGRSERALAALGRKLFNDPRLSANGLVSCASCHDPERAFTDGAAVGVGLAPMTKNTPTVVNTFRSGWFFWDGRADSLAAQALLPLEDAPEHGISRVFAVRHLMAHYQQDYEEAFGLFPAALRTAGLPEHGLPAPAKVGLSIAVSAHALSTLGGSELLGEILRDAQAARLAPAMELSRRAVLVPPQPISWIAAWESLSDDERTAVNRVYADLGLALEAFEKNLIAVDSPFDRFAQRLGTGATPADALAPGFGVTELTGLKLFLGPGGCASCHSGPAMSDQQFHNTGLAQRGETVDVGRASGVLRAIADPFNCLGAYLARPAGSTPAESCRELPFLDTENQELVGAFKTPSLRNVAVTGPYMHDGRFVTLREVLEHYNELETRPATGHREETLKPLAFTEEELLALEAFLGALNSPIRDLAQEEATSAAQP